MFAQAACKVPPEALDRLSASLDNYDRVRASTPPLNLGDDEEVARLRERLKNKRDTISWSDISLAELCLVDLLNTEAEIRAGLTGWRRRLREVAGETRYTQYLTTAPDISPGKSSIFDLRADLLECIRAVFYFYSAYGIAAGSRSSVTKALFRVALVVILSELLFSALLILRNASGGYVLPVDSGVRAIVQYYIAASICAVLGSVISVQRRQQDPNVDVDPLFRYIQTTADKFSIAFVSPVFGAIFGLLAFALLQSRLLSTTLISIGTNGLPSNWSDVAGLLIFGFLAGFAEQLVPDALTRIAARALGGAAGSTNVSSSSQVTPTTSQPKTIRPAGATPAIAPGQEQARVPAAGETTRESGDNAPEPHEEK
jgi:hypothetical protein